MSSWAATELQTTDLGDVRRNRRLVHLVEDLAARPESTVPQAVLMCDRVYCRRLRVITYQNR